MSLNVSVGQYEEKAKVMSRPATEGRSSKCTVQTIFFRITKLKILKLSCECFLETTRSSLIFSGKKRFHSISQQMKVAVALKF